MSEPKQVQVWKVYLYLDFSRRHKKGFPYSAKPNPRRKAFRSYFHLSPIMVNFAPTHGLRNFFEPFAKRRKGGRGTRDEGRGTTLIWNGIALVSIEFNRKRYFEDKNRLASKNDHFHAGSANLKRCSCRKRKNQLNENLQLLYVYPYFKNPITIFLISSKSFPKKVRK